MDSVGVGEDRLSVRIDGRSDGPAVLLLNSLGSTLDLWSAQVEAWASRYRVIRYDMRGHGLSGVPAGEYTLDDLGRDACRVLDAVGVDDAHVCGISIGALTGLWLAIHRPERVRTLVSANTAAKVGTPDRWRERVAKVRTEGMTAIADMAMTTWFTPEFRAGHPDTVARFHRMVASTSPDGYVGCCAALRDADLRGDLHRIRARTLVVAGDLDVSATTADAALITTSIPGATQLTLATAHISNVERAEEFSEAAIRHFA